ncbi:MULTISPECIES: SCP2 sterol-binding domain-containing protein [unclassified Frankia]|uniref:SCP2 sterol-binding domain-containing protein n=1 Tax=unclassified Frankia TaxID=2632575 RepID=UPI002AD2A11E|nr:MULTISPECIES: SCP2 sterol-binding domain-containing protein [unclassified Frankia]
MATRQQCAAALRTLADRLNELANDRMRELTPDRTIVCRIPDLGTSFSAELRDGSVLDINEGEDEDETAKVTFTVNSDDLVAVSDGSLRFSSAWASGRLKVDASMRDLLRMRSLL